MCVIDVAKGYCLCRKDSISQLTTTKIENRMSLCSLILKQACRFVTINGGTESVMGKALSASSGTDQQVKAGHVGRNPGGERDTMGARWGRHLMA